MTMDPNTANVITAAISALPSIIALIRGAHAETNPTASPLTEVQALAALQAAVAQSLAQDQALAPKVATAAELDVHTGSTGE